MYEIEVIYSGPQNKAVDYFISGVIIARPRLFWLIRYVRLKRVKFENMLNINIVVKQ